MTASRQVVEKIMTLEEFLIWKTPENRCELRNGVVVEMQLTGQHEEIGGFLILKFSLEIGRLELPYRLPKQALIRPQSGETGYFPDVVVLHPELLRQDPQWQKASTVNRGDAVPLVIEIVSGNWRDDYAHRLADYEALGIQEYWIVDYLGLGGRRYIGDPKQPTLSIYTLVNEEYQVAQFRREDRIRSQIFPQLELTADLIFRAGRTA